MALIVAPGMVGAHRAGPDVLPISDCDGSNRRLTGLFSVESLDIVSTMPARFPVEWAGP